MVSFTTGMDIPVHSLQTSNIYIHSSRNAFKSCNSVTVSNVRTCWGFSDHVPGFVLDHGLHDDDVHFTIVVRRFGRQRKLVTEVFIMWEDSNHDTMEMRATF